MMARNGFFGVKNSHFAIMTDEDNLTYDTPVHMAGTVEIKMEPSVENASSYADNEVWLQKQLDTGGSGTMSFYDVEGTTDNRELIAKLTGYQIDDNGRIIYSADVTPLPFAFMCEQPGHVMGKRICKYKCQMSKPNLDAKTLEDKPDITQLDFDFTWKPITLSNGLRTSGYADYQGTSTYETFFEKVDTAITLKTTTTTTGA